MNEQIKQRIAQLNNGEVPNGYEKTKIGTFPVGWKTTTLDELLEFKSGVNADKEKYNSGVKMISVMDILTDSSIYYDKIKGQVDIDKKTLDTYSVTYGDILFQRSSETFEDAGKSNVYLDKDRTATYSGFVIRGKKKADYNPYFLNEALRIGQVRNQIIRNAAGSQHINVGQDSLAKIIVPLASDAEQSKIAEILMKWDEAIELREKHIAALESKKEAILQRLVVKNDGWKKVKLKDILIERSIFATKEDGYPHVTLSKAGVNKKTDRYNRDFLVKSDDKKYKITYPNDICYNPANLKFGVICVNKFPEEAIFSPIYVTYEISEMYNVDFIGAILCSNNFINYIRKYEEGTVYERQAVKSEDFLRGEIWVPSSKAEQDRIADVIHKINDYVDLVQQELETLQLQRKTLQQYLLNGIVRV